MADRGAMVSDPGLGRWVTMEERSLRISIRNLDALFSGLALPVMLMLFFVYLLGGAIQTGTAYVTYVVPGVLLLCAAFGASLTAVSVSNDMKGGVIDRFRSMDVSGAAILGGPRDRQLGSERGRYHARPRGRVPHRVPTSSGARRLACGRRRAPRVHPGHVVAFRSRGTAHPLPGSGQRVHVLRDLPSLFQAAPSFRSRRCRAGSRASRSTNR